MKHKLILQLFASKGSSSTSGSSSTTMQSQEGGSSSHTEGGSKSHSEGGSHSYTQSHSETQTHSEGGAHGESRGVSYASGEVEDNTAAHRGAYNTDYEQGQKVSDAYQRLQDTIDNKPGFQSQYENKLNALYDQIMNREKFNYNFNEDQMYQMYKDQYTQQGQRAMQDTIGQASALTGGYGNTYAQTAGQQQYQNYLQDLNNMIPTLRNQAYQQYQDEGNELLNKYNITGDAYNREYGQYRDQVADWQSDRSFNQGMYSDERNFDYNQFAQERNYWNQEYWNERNSAQSNEQTSDESNWNDSRSVTNGWSTTDENHWEDTESAFWENTDATNWSRGTTTTNATNWSNTIPMGGSGSSGGSSSSSISNNSGWGTENTPKNKEQVDPNKYKGQNLSDQGYPSTTEGYNTTATRVNNQRYAPYDIKQGDAITMMSDSEISSAVNDYATASGIGKATVIAALKKAGLTDSEIQYIKDQAQKNGSRWQ